MNMEGETDNTPLPQTSLRLKHHFTQRQRLLLQGGDSLLCLFVFFPSMVCYWRGIWDFSGAVVNPTGDPMGEWRLVGIGSMAILGYATLPLFQNRVGARKSARYILSTRVIMYLHATCAMCYWRGVWILADAYIQPGWKHDLQTALLTGLLLLVTRGFRNCIFPPFYTALDTRKDLMEPFPRFGSKPKDGVVYILDALFSHFFILTTTIVFWRSGWNFYGHFWFPHDPLKSDWTALIVGYGLCSILFSLEQLLRKLTRIIQDNCEGRRGGDALRMLWEDAIYIIVYMCHIFLWRGGWNLNARFLYADLLWGGLVNHLVGTSLLMGLQLFSYASAVGCAVDGSEPDGLAFWPTRYLRHYQHKRGRQIDELDEEEDQYTEDNKESFVSDRQSDVTEQASCDVEDAKDTTEIAI